MIFFNRWSVDYVNKKVGVIIKENNFGGSRGLLVQIFIAEIIFGGGEEE